MRKFIVLLWVVFLPITSIVAQSDKDEQEVYNQLKEWVVVKLTIAYMEDLRQFTSENKGEKGSEKEYETYKTIVNDYREYSEEMKINLENVGQSLIIGSWGKTKRNVFDAYKTLDINSDYSFNNIQASGYTEEMSRRSFNNTITVLNKKYEDLLNDKKNIEETPKSKKIIEEVKTENKQLEKEQIKLDGEYIEERYSGIPFWIYGFSGVLIVAIFIIFTLNSKNKKLTRSLKKTKRIYNIPTSNQDLFSPTSEKLRDEIQVLKITEDKYKREVDSLKKEIEILKNNSASAYERTITKTFSETPSQSINLEVPQQNTGNLIYLSSPFQNLTFANEDASNNKTLNSLYQVEFNEQMQTGELSVLVDTDLSKALNSPDSYLETACTYDNEYNNNARAIKIIEKGQIKLDGEDWIVTKKVRIKFI